ncbi:MAG: cobalt transporter CbiM [Pseudomonadota bacterium]
MHISEGVLSAPVLAAGAVATAAGVAVGLRRIDYDRIPQVAIMSAGFFVASLIHVPIGVASVHLVLNGLVGLVLGWAAFPAILVALALQALLFQFGGLTSLGINTLNMALPAVVCGLAFGRPVRGRNDALALASGFACGSLAIVLSGIMVATALICTGESFGAAAGLILAAHLPVALAEGLLSAMCVGFLRKVSPEVLEVARALRAVAR